MKFFFTIACIFLLPLSLFGQSISGTWSLAPSSAFIVRTGLTSSVVNHKIFVIGGRDLEPIGSQLFVEVDFFDSLTNLWSRQFPIGTFTPRDGLASAVVNDKIYVMGGTGNDGKSLNTLEVFDPITSTWVTPTTTGTYTARSGLSASEVNGKIYVIGGDSSLFYDKLNTLEVFDPITNIWSTPQTNGKFAARAGHTASVVDGKIYIIGGNYDDTIHRKAVLINEVTVFDPSDNTWSIPKTSGIFTPRTGLSSCVLEKKIYVIGGSDLNTPLDILEVFDPSTSSWNTPSTSGTLTGRDYFTSSVLADKIYVIGGFDKNGKIPYTNEVFTSSTSDVKSGPTSQNLRISPNPTTSIISISNIPINTQHITITNILGETVMEFTNPQTTNYTTDLSKFPAGLYYARFIAPNSVTVKKIIRQ